MSEPLRNKLRILVYTSLALALGLGLASGLRHLRGEPSPERPWLQAASLPTATLPQQGAVTSTQLPAARPDALAQVNQMFVTIAQAVTPAVVSVDTRGSPQRLVVPGRFEELFGPFGQHPETPYDVPLGRGSGFIVSADGYVLTNNHVVADAEKITVELPDGRQFDANLVGRDPTTDVAVLKITGGGLPTVPLGDSESTQVGEFVLAIGNPGTAATSALPFTVTAGIVSAKGRNLGIIQRAAEGSQYAIEDLIQTDAVINPGNSGGPLVNSRGEVIGINTAIASLTGYYQGYGFAIPISLARNVMDDLIEYGRVRRAALVVSVTPVTPGDVREYGLPGPHGAVIQDFPEDSPAERAGMQREDVIIAVDDKPVSRVGELQRIIASYNPGDRVRVTAVRHGRQMTFNVRLAEAKVPQPEATEPVAAGRPANMLIGIQVSDLDPRLAEWANLAGTDLKGVLVTEVAPYGPAANAGVLRGYLIQAVNSEAVTNVGEFDRALGKVKSGEVVSLRTVRADADGSLIHRTFNIPVPQ
jgi:serine protease Do